MYLRRKHWNRLTNAKDMDLEAVSVILKYGIAFSGKKVCIKASKQ